MLATSLRISPETDEVVCERRSLAVLVHRTCILRHFIRLYSVWKNYDRPRSLRAPQYNGIASNLEAAAAAAASGQTNRS